MIELLKGDKIYSKTSKSVHIVEEVETICDITVVFTEDSKCFPLSDVEKHSDSFLSYYFLKVFRKEVVIEEEEQKAIEILRKFPLVTIVKS